MDILQTTLENLMAQPEYLILAGVAISAFVIVQGLSGLTAGDSPATRRMHAGSIKKAHGADFDLVQGDNSDPHGLLKAFVPSSQKERTKLSGQLRRAGIVSKHAVRSFYAFRVVMGIFLPLLFVFAMALPPEILVQPHIADVVQKISWVHVMQIVTALMVAGFYVPALWVRGRIKKRRQAIEFSLPNALDLLQIAMEAGLGFDAAMMRVSHELARAAPEISQEFMIFQLELQAGKERQAALLDMAHRVDVEELTAFANVILQSNQFGTTVSTALNRYSTDMRFDRELRAQEKANRLPVQMSAVMALCMMPVLLLICLAPMLIRFMHMF
ncbi:MAG: type II secretion system F family protein [Sulfitobacter sp.]|nr:type II secretion system F family protein [Sulfitobacter sp.]